MALNQALTGPLSFSSQPYPISIIIATLSLLTALLILPPMFWHFRNRNIGATSFVFWLAISLFFNYVNAALWSNDNFDSWYNGAGLCDVEVKIQMAAQVALPASFACTLRALAIVLDTDRVTLVQTSRQRRRRCAVEILCCFGLPILQMLFQFVVQTGRYYVFGISGCAPMAASSWLTILLLYVPPTVWECVDTYFATIILIRIYRYRLTFSTILASSNTTKFRFLRLYLICIFWLLCAVPSSIYTFVRAYNQMNQAGSLQGSFNWNEVHGNTWSAIIFVRSYGQTSYASWISLASGLGVFIFFGFGKDAVAMYKAGFTSIGMGRCFHGPRLEGSSTTTSITTTSLSDKVKLIYKRISISTWSSRSSNAPPSPSGKSCTDTISSADTLRESRDVEKAMHISDGRSLQPASWEVASQAGSARHLDVDIALAELGHFKTTVYGNT